jgi:hypothetical protein
MNLSDQVCSLELAKRLKELGVKQESLFYYGNEGGLFYRKEYSIAFRIYSAFTVSELGEMLPSSFEHEIEEEFNIFNFIEWKIDGKFMCNYYSSFPKKIYHISQEKHFIEDNEADARAKMMIYLIENKLIEV